MTDRPTPPPDPAEPGPGTPAEPAPPAAPDDTAVLPQGAAGEHPSPGAEGAPGNATAPAEHPAPGAPAAPGVPTAAYAAPAAAPGPGRARRWWAETTATSGGRAGLAVGAVLASVVLLAGVLLAGGLVLHAVRGGHDGRMTAYDERGPMGMDRGDGPGRSEDAPGQQRKDKGDKRGGNGQGGNRQDGTPDQRGGPQQLPPGMGQGMMPGNGRGNGMGAGGLGGNVLHGEFTALVNGTPTVMVVQTGEVTTYTSGQSLAIRSTDGFAATYSLNGTTAPSRGADRIATGAQVRVVATKEGMKVTRLVVIS